jgi:hypothetical protein
VQQFLAVTEWQKHAMPFVVPMVLREQSNHATDCYFYMVPPVSGGITKEKKRTIVYLNVPSALRQIPHGEGISVPEPSKEFTIDSDEVKGESTSGSPEPPASTEPHASHGRTSAPQPQILAHDELNILFAICSCQSAKQSYLGQDLNNGIFSRKMSEFPRFAVVVSSWRFLQKGR